MIKKLKYKIKDSIKPIKPLWNLWHFIGIKKLKLKYHLLIYYSRIIKKKNLFFNSDNQNYTLINEKSKESIKIVCASDKNFVMPLTVMLKSLEVNLKRYSKIIVYVLEKGISNSNKNKILKSLNADKIKIKWISVDESKLQNMKVDGHITLATYYRILIPELLPKKINKVIYLDCDLLVNEDISNLWDKKLGDYYILSVPETCRYGLYVSSINGLKLYKKFGIPSKTANFNAGVLLINLKKWRKDKINLRILDYLKNNKEFVKLHDQEGLNLICTGKIGKLNYKWNQLTSIFSYKSWKESPIKDKQKFRELIINPYIVHYNNTPKPWNKGCSHPYNYLFYKYLDMTEWRGWRP